ncbi:MAG: hypothetical protein QMD65_03075 [Patescibacteria group bacterium]|nr:hypothetical protein [Patescibacteria group bacterium]
MTKKEQAMLKKIVCAIKMPRQCDIPTANTAYNSFFYDKEVIRPLERLCGWNEEDEKIVTTQAILLKQETENGKFKERLNRVKEFLAKKKWWITGTIAVTAATTGIIKHFVQKKKNNNHSNEDQNTEK